MLRGAMTFAFSVFGRTVIALRAMVLLLFATSILIDLKMYVSAGLAGVLSSIAVVVFAVQYRRQIVAKRRRARLNTPKANPRAVNFQRVAVDDAGMYQRRLARSTIQHTRMSVSAPTATKPLACA
jgi:hypothetical protein